ncbi:hypothetical protein FKP32DRAFT_637965 [Trametes sanguinea]|nr:hypothetical protein FKP32DRAFT_637965 [Trametes sanguinea]
MPPSMYRPRVSSVHLSETSSTLARYSIAIGQPPASWIPVDTQVPALCARTRVRPHRTEFDWKRPPERTRISGTRLDWNAGSVSKRFMALFRGPPRSHASMSDSWLLNKYCAYWARVASGVPNLPITDVPLACRSSIHTSPVPGHGASTKASPAKGRLASLYRACAKHSQRNSYPIRSRYRSIAMMSGRPDSVIESQGTQVQRRKATGRAVHLGSDPLWLAVGTSWRTLLASA